MMSPPRSNPREGLDSTSFPPTTVPESLEPSSTASSASDSAPSAVAPEAIGPHEAVRGRVRDHPRQTIHPLGRRTKAPRAARLETLVTDLKPRTPSPTPGPSSSHRQLELDLVATPDSSPTDASAPEIVDPPKTPEPTDPPSIATNPVAARRWAMTWKPDADANDRNSQHPAARVARENVDAAINQPSIPAIQSPTADAVLTDPGATLVTEETPCDEPEAIPETAAAPEAIAPAHAPLHASPEATPAAPSSPAPSASGTIRVAAAGWIVAVLIAFGWLIASNRSTIPPAPKTAAGVSPAETPISTNADTEAIMGLEAAIVDLEFGAAGASARISALEAEVEEARSDATYLNRERSLLQAELEGLMEIIEAPATATTETSDDG